jgi:MraZ protein
VFRGPSKVTLDAKGRLAIPSRHRERILARADGQLVATVDREHCLLIYPLPDWEELERKLVRLPALKAETRGLLRAMLGYATEMEMDANGRILLPRELRDFAGLDRQAMLIGQGNKFELWDEQRWAERTEEWLAAENAYEDLPEELQSLSF